jgi:hypothetical protein
MRICDAERANTRTITVTTTRRTPRQSHERGALAGNQDHLQLRVSNLLCLHESYLKCRGTFYLALCAKDGK